MGSRGLALRILAVIISVIALAEAGYILHLSAVAAAAERREEVLVENVRLCKTAMDATGDLTELEARLVVAYRRTLVALLDRLKAAPAGSAAHALLGELRRVDARLE